MSSQSPSPCRLRQNWKETSRPHFSGESGRACELFVREVRSHAFSNGKQRDDGWQADFAAVCLDGPALRWFDELSREVQEDWTRLRKALLEKWPSDGEEISQEAIPTPAAAPPSASAPYQAPSSSTSLIRGTSSSSRSSAHRNDEPETRTPTSQVPIPSAAAIQHITSATQPQPSYVTRRGRIKVRRGNETEQRYVRRTAGWAWGQYKTTGKIGEALVVEYVTDGGDGKGRLFTIINGPSEYQFVGIRWVDADPIMGKGSTHMGYVTPVDASMKAKAFLSGPIATQIWHIDDQGAIHALYQPEGKTEVCELDFIAIDNTLYVAADQAAYEARHGKLWAKAECVFEEI